MVPGRHRPVGPGRPGRRYDSSERTLATLPPIRRDLLIRVHRAGAALPLPEAVLTGFGALRSRR